MVKTLHIARVSLVEFVRRKLYWLPLFGGALIYVTPLLVNAWGMAGFDRVTRDLGLTLMDACKVGVAVILGAWGLSFDTERRTLYSVLTRPVTRLQYLSGKLVAIVGVLFATLLWLGLCFGISSKMALGQFPARILEAVLMDTLEGTVLASLCLMLATRLTPAVAAVAGLTVWQMAGLTPLYLETFLEGQRPLQAHLVQGLRVLTPHFELFHIKNAIVHDFPLQPGFAVSIGVYGVIWTALFLYLADWLFSRRDL